MSDDWSLVLFRVYPYLVVQNCFVKLVCCHLKTLILLVSFAAAAVLAQEISYSCVEILSESLWVEDMQDTIDR